MVYLKMEMYLKKLGSTLKEILDLTFCTLYVIIIFVFDVHPILFIVYLSLVMNLEFIDYDDVKSGKFKTRRVCS